MTEGDYDSVDEVFEAAHDGEFGSAKEFQSVAKSYKDEIEGDTRREVEYALAAASVAEEGVADAIQEYEGTVGDIQNAVQELAAKHQQAVDSAYGWRENAKKMQGLAAGVALRYAGFVDSVGEAVERLNGINDEFYEAMNSFELEEPPTEGINRMNETADEAFEALGVEPSEDDSVLEPNTPSLTGGEE